MFRLIKKGHPICQECNLGAVVKLNDTEYYCKVCSAKFVKEEPDLNFPTEKQFWERAEEYAKENKDKLVNCGVKEDEN